ncbi:MAG: hypothetical protein JXL97_18935 [Bacteroidales bacterium]|nr:hypothetical protein [Bacteroidales bacterium]
MKYFYLKNPGNHFVRKGAKIWVNDTPQSPENERQTPFSYQDYLKRQGDLIYFRWIADQFECGNEDCASKEIKCLWYHYQPYDMGVDDTFGEFLCPVCGKYTFVEYNRDSS